MTATIRAITAPELALLRTPAQGSILYLAGTETPPTVFACQVNQTFSTHDMIAEVTYDNVTSGAYASVLSGMTVWVGSAPGLYDLGQARVRKAATSTKLYIGEGSEIDWANNLYLTVVDEMGIWAKHVHIASQIVKMDYDVAFTDQHVKFAPVPIMGPNVILDVAAYPVTVTFPEAVNTWVFDSTISAWLWTASAGTLSGSTTNNPTLTIASYPANGLIRVALKPTSAAAANFTGYRYIRVYDATHRPLTTFDLNDCSGSFDEGGWSFSVTLYANATRAAIRDRAPMTLFARDYYGSTQQSIGQSAGRENIVCSGWVDGESIVEDPNLGTVAFTVQGPQFWIGKITGFPSGVEIAIKTPAAWTSMPGLTVDRALWHLFHWRSTLTAVCDVNRSADTRYAATLRSVSASLWDQIKEIAYTSIFAAPGFDPYGRLFISIDPQLTPSASRTWATVMNITKVDWVEAIDIRRKTTPDISMLSLSGIKVNSAGSGTAYFSLSNGHVFKRFGRVETLNKLLLQSQAQSNTLAGMYVGWKNSQYPDVRIKLAANNRMITLFQNQFLSITVASADTLRGIEYSGNLIPRSVSYQWDAKNGILSTEVTCEAETFAELNMKGDIPEDNSGVDPSTPPVPPVPPLPPLPPIILPPSMPNTSHPTDVVIASSNFGVLYTTTFDADEPEWLPMNDGLTDTEYNSIGNLVKTSNGKLFIMCDVFGGGYKKIYSAPALGAAWSLVRLYDDVVGDHASSGWFHALGANPLAEEQIAVFGEVTYLYTANYQNGRFMVGNSGGIPIVSVMYTYGNVLSANMYTLGGWRTVHPRLGGVLISPTSVPAFFKGGVDPNTDLSLSGGGSNAVGVGTQDIVYAWGGLSGYAKIVGGSTITNSTSIIPALRQSLAPSPIGLKIMAASGGTHTPYRSADAGATWASLSAIIPVGMSVWENCNDDNRWIYGGGTNMKFTVGFGDSGSNFNKEGNLTYLAPLINITNIRFMA